jgi:hypothetical protein
LNGQKHTPNGQIQVNRDEEAAAFLRLPLRVCVNDAVERVPL